MIINIHPSMFGTINHRTELFSYIGKCGNRYLYRGLSSNNIVICLRLTNLGGEIDSCCMECMINACQNLKAKKYTVENIKY